MRPVSRSCPMSCVANVLSVALRHASLARLKAPMRSLVASGLVAATALALGCTGGKQPPGGAQPNGADKAPVDASDGSAPATARKLPTDVDIPFVEYAWDKDAGDPTVSAEDGGPGFTGEGWETNMRFAALGSPEAVKGGSVVMYTPSWPATLRQCGKGWNTALNYVVADLCYQALLGLHPTTLEFVPALATHWWISEDKSTYRFRINPKARWSDGTEVTSADVVATFKLRTDPTTLEPSAILTYGKLNPPKAVSKYIVEVTAKQPNWRNFLYFASSLSIFPAHEIGSLSGSEYLDKYQFAYTGSTGPYHVKAEDIVLNQSVALTRNAKWWDADNPAWQGIYNFDRVQYNVERNLDAAFEKAKKGDIDYYSVPKAQWWAQDLQPGKVPLVDRGLVVKRKIFTQAPESVQGIAINTTRPPLDDVRVRKALCQLLPRETLIRTLMFNEYLPLTSYYQNSPCENTNNEETKYDEFAAVELLKEAGWTQVDGDVYRTKDGKRLEMTLSYRTKLLERIITPYQEACKRAGIDLKLQLLDGATAWKNLTEREFDLSLTAWGAVEFPNPETQFHSRLAKETSNNNVTAFANERVDELCALYDREYDADKRAEYVREIDGIVFNSYQYVLMWYIPCERLLYTNRFSMPKWGGLRVHDHYELFYCWWVDPAKDKAFREALANGTSELAVPEIENHFWEAWTAAGGPAKAVDDK